MWQTKYHSAAAKYLEVGVDFRPCNEGDFLTGRPQSVILDTLARVSYQPWTFLWRFQHGDNCAPQIFWHDGFTALGHFSMRIFGTRHEDCSTADILGRGRYPNWLFWRRGFWGRYALPRNYLSSLIWALVHCIASLTLVRFGSILASRLPMYTVHQCA